MSEAISFENSSVFFKKDDIFLAVDAEPLSKNKTAVRKTFRIGRKKIGFL